MSSKTFFFGYVLGPCVNATGRLDTARHALRLFETGQETEAEEIARDLVDLNQERKELTLQGVEMAKKLCEEGGYENDPVLVLFLPDVHESIAGLIAGRIREMYNRPVFVLTRGEEGVKGSGRSTENYSMYENMCGCAELFTKFGGHPMAAGLSLPEENVEKFRRKINENCPLTVEEVCPDIHIDMAMPVGYASTELIHQFALLEPFGLKATPIANSQLGEHLAEEGWHCHHDHFKDSNPNIEWKATLDQAEKIGLGTREYELKIIK